MPQILYLDGQPFGFADVLRLVTLAAIEPGVFSLQRIAGLIVVESLQRREPADQFEIFSVMFGMAFAAVIPIGVPGVQAAAFGDPLRNLGVAFPALQRRRTGPDFVATNALGWPA